jgi:hypothetical protein
MRSGDMLGKPSCVDYGRELFAAIDRGVNTFSVLHSSDKISSRDISAGRDAQQGRQYTLLAKPSAIFNLDKVDHSSSLQEISEDHIVYCPSSVDRKLSISEGSVIIGSARGAWNDLESKGGYFTSYLGVLGFAGVVKGRDDKSDLCPTLLRKVTKVSPVTVTDGKRGSSSSSLGSLRLQSDSTGKQCYTLQTVPLDLHQLVRADDAEFDNKAADKLNVISDTAGAKFPVKRSLDGTPSSDNNAIVLTDGAIAGIVIGAVVAVVPIAVLIYFLTRNNQCCKEEKARKYRNGPAPQLNVPQDPQDPQYALWQQQQQQLEQQQQQQQYPDQLQQQYGLPPQQPYTQQPPPQPPQIQMRQPPPQLQISVPPPATYNIYPPEPARTQPHTNSPHFITSAPDSAQYDISIGQAGVTSNQPSTPGSGKSTGAPFLPPPRAARRLSATSTNSADTGTPRGSTVLRGLSFSNRSQLRGDASATRTTVAGAGDSVLSGDSDAPHGGDMDEIPPASPPKKSSSGRER